MNIRQTIRLLPCLVVLLFFQAAYAQKISAGQSSETFPKTTTTLIKNSMAFRSSFYRKRALGAFRNP
jgi:hypothetical protein